MDHAENLYMLSKGNGIGSKMTIDRISPSGASLWGSGVEITSNGTYGFNGTISMNVDSNNDLYVTWDASNNNVYTTKVLSSGSLGWAFSRVGHSLSAPLNAQHSYARITSNDTLMITWNESDNTNTYAKVQKLTADGDIILPAGGKTIGLSNVLYGYPKIALNGDEAACFYTTSDVSIAVQNVQTNNTFKYPSSLIISRAYLTWNFYTDYVPLDNATGCSGIFWTGFDLNIYGANACTSAGVLPIKTTSLTAEVAGTQNKISWEGYNQLAGDVYEIQRSNNGSNFTILGTLPAKGTDNKYIFWDKQPLCGNNFYRIKQISVNGNFQYSHIVKTNTGNCQQIAINAYPNPAKNLLTVKLNNTPTANAIITISDITGKIVKTIPVKQEQFTIDISPLAKAIYFISYQDNNGKTVLKIEKD